MDRLSLPELSPDDARIQNGLIGRQRQLTAQLDGAAYSIELSALTAFANDDLVAEMLIGGRTWQLALQRVEQFPAMKSLLGDADLANLPDDLQLAVLNAVFGSWMDAFAALSGWEVSLKSLQTKSAVSSDDVTLAIGLTDQSASCWRGWVSLPRDMAPIVRDVLGRFPLRPKSEMSAIAIPVRLEYGLTDLCVSDFRTLRLSDVLMIDRFAGGDRQHLALRAGNISRWTAKIDGHHILVEQSMAAIEESVGAGARPADSLIDSLPVRVTFDLGEQVMSVQELSSLKPGFTWELASPLDRPVTVRANGKAICQGELVAIGERIGVRFLEVLDERQSA